jgi:ABC-2 type transport system permease protein
MSTRGLGHALAYEWARIRSVRITWWIAGLSIVATALAAWGYSALVSTMMSADPSVDGREAVVMMLSKPSFAPIAASLIGVFAVGTDYRYGTMCATLLVTPRRGVALTAKAVVVAGFGVAVALVNLAVAWAVGLLMVGRGLTGSASVLELAGLHLGQVALTVGAALLGSFVAALVRSQLVGLAIVFAVPYAVEPGLRTMVMFSGQQTLARFVGFLPFSAGNAMTDISGGSSDTLLASAAVRVGPLTGALIFFGMVAMAGAGAMARFRRQDVK